MVTYAVKRLVEFNAVHGAGVGAGVGTGEETA